MLSVERQKRDASPVQHKSARSHHYCSGFPSRTAKNLRMECGGRAVTRNESKPDFDLHWREWAGSFSNDDSDSSESQFYDCSSHGQHGRFELPGTPAEASEAFVARFASSCLVHVFTFDRQRINRCFHVSQYADFYRQPEH